MTEHGTDVLNCAPGVFEESAALVRCFLAELRLLVRKAESGMKISGAYSPQADLERAYFRDVLQLLFDHTVEEFGKLLNEVKPVALRAQLRDDLVLNVRRHASMIVIDSDLCDTVLMNEFSALMAQFLTDVDRAVRRPPMAA